VKRISPDLALLLIAPLLGELVSGHMSPLQFFNPIVFAVMALPYGCGALLCRELARRWGKGWLSLLLLAAAYGMYEEGIVSRAFFDPHWLELGALANHDYFAGINWTYSISLLHFHIAISILSSVMLAELLYPERRAEPWLSGGQMALCGLVMAAWMPILAVLAQAGKPLYVPALGLSVLTSLSIAGLVLAARLAPAQPLCPTGSPASSPYRFLLLGALNVTIVFGTVYLLPEFYGSPPLIASIAFLLAFNALSFWLFLRWSGNVLAWDDRHRLALVSGLLAFFVVVNFLGDLENFEARSFVSLATVFALWQLRRPVLARTQGASPMSDG
jgi:putative flippase GtrA